MTVTRVFAARSRCPAPEPRRAPTSDEHRDDDRDAVARGESGSCRCGIVVGRSGRIGGGSCELRRPLRRPRSVSPSVSTSAIADSASACSTSASSTAAAAASASAASSAASSSSGGSSPPSGTTSVFTSTWHVLEELDRHRVAPDPLQRVGRDLAPVDTHLPRAPDLVGDVGGRDRAEQRARSGRPSPRSAGRSCRGAPRSPRPARRVRASCFARSASTRCSSATRAGVAFSASRRGRR